MGIASAGHARAQEAAMTRWISGLAAAVPWVACLMALPASGQDLGDVDSQWRRGPGRDATVTLAEIVRRGYELRAARPSPHGAFLYLQRGTSLYRCQDEVFAIAGKTEPNCFELVDPYKAKK
jgi:hypothetical protein